MNRDEEMPPPGARGPGYIALPNECGPSDQTDINRTVFLDPQRRWIIILMHQIKLYSCAFVKREGRILRMLQGLPGI